MPDSPRTDYRELVTRLRKPSCCGECGPTVYADIAGGAASALEALQAERDAAEARVAELEEAIRERETEYRELARR